MVQLPACKRNYRNRDKISLRRTVSNLAAHHPAPVEQTNSLYDSENGRYQIQCFGNGRGHIYAYLALTYGFTINGRK